MAIAYRSVLGTGGGDAAIVQSLTVTQQPTKTIYMEGEPLNLTGLRVTAVVQPFSGEVTNYVTTTPANEQLVSSGISDILVKYGNAVTSTPITVYGIDEIEITTQPATTEYLLGDTLDLTGIVVTGYTNNRAMSTNITDLCIFSPADGDTLSTSGSQTITVSYKGLSTSFDVRCLNLPAWDNRGLDYNSWDTIQQYIDAGRLGTVASVGDIKSFELNGKTYHAEVVSINDGTGSAASWYPSKTVDFICTELYETAYRYNPTSTSAGGFPSSELKGTLENTIYPLLPSDLKDVIIEKSHSYNIDTSGTMATDSTKLWLPTNYEISGYQRAPGETGLNNKVYTLASNIKNRNGQTSANLWWFGSIAGFDTFYVVDSGGDMRWSDYANSNNGVPLCFRIG